LTNCFGESTPARPAPIQRNPQQAVDPILPGSPQYAILHLVARRTPDGSGVARRRGLDSWSSVRDYRLMDRRWRQRLGPSALGRDGGITLPQLPRPFERFIQPTHLRFTEGSRAWIWGRFYRPIMAASQVFCLIMSVGQSFALSLTGRASAVGGRRSTT
jgi:hypothetical protein